VSTAAADAAPLRTTHVSGLHNVLSELNRLHRQRLRAAGEEQSPVQLCVANIVAACTDADAAARAADDLTVIGTRHPARAIVVRADPQAPPHLEADVSLRCASGTGMEFCTELLHLDVGGEAAYHLTSVVTPLLVPDVPVQLWLVGAPPLTQPFTPDVVAMCERIILDSGAYVDATATLSLLAMQLQRFGAELRIADLAWERIAPWRLLIAQAFASHHGLQLLEHVESAQIVSGPSQRADAMLCGGWLASRLSGLSIDISAEDCKPGLHLVRLRSGTASLEARERDTLLEAVISVEGHTVFTQTVQPPAAVSSTEEARLIIRLMAAAGDDESYRASVLRAAAATALP
jgi:glucose-6-phosphate dehydrogenase assembly protein OpcA